MRVTLSFNGIAVDAQLHKGITFLRGYSGTGKTLLLSALELYCRNQGISCYLCDYHSQNLSEDKIYASCSDVQVLLLDNADLYLTPTLLKRLKDIEYIIISKKILFGFDLVSATSCLVHYNNMQLILEEF